MLPRVVVVTDRRLVPNLPAALAAALDAVPRDSLLVLLREKDLPGRELFALAEAIAAVTAGRAKLVVSGRADVALAVGADGVHAGGDAPPAAALKRRWPELLVGASVHAPDEDAPGADYVLLAPIFAVPGKGAPLGLGALVAAARRGVPVFALGGIDARNAAAARAAGAYGVAAMRSALEVSDPAAACAALVRAAS